MSLQSKNTLGYYSTNICHNDNFKFRSQISTITVLWCNEDMSNQEIHPTESFDSNKMQSLQLKFPVHNEHIN